MPSIFLYLIKCSISLSIVWLFYQLLLRRLTFYSMNRWYLIGYGLLSFFLPLIHIAFPAEERLAGNMQMIRYIPVITVQPSGASSGTREVVYTGWDLLLVVLALGALLLLGRLLIRWLSLRRIQNRALLIGDSHVAIYHVREPIIPFSFGKAIYINPGLHSEEECEEIILHEYVHVKQRHTVDIVVAEILCIVSWFNPFSWLIRHSIRQNLEFIADRQVLASGMDRKAYQYHLLKVVGEARYRLANNFNFSSLKKRIIMMNKSRSAKLHLVKFLFIVPLAGVLLVAFRDKVDIHLPSLHKKVSLPVVVSARPLKDTTPASGPFVLRKDMDSVKPMFVIDEVEASEGAMKKMKPQDIFMVDVLKNESAVANFGPAAKGGVVLIFTKTYAPNRKNEVLLKNGRKVRLAVADPPPPGPTPPGDKHLMRDTLSHAQLLRPTGVEEFSYDSIKVGNTTYSAHGTSLTYSDTTSPDYHPLGSEKFLKEALIVVDEKVVDYENLRLDPDGIESVTILKSKAAQALYGAKGEKGAVVIVTKKDRSVKGQSLTIETDKDGPVTLKADSIRWKNN